MAGAENHSIRSFNETDYRLVQVWTMDVAIEIIVILLVDIVKCRFKNEYKGEEFPLKYLLAEDVSVLSQDLDTYIKYLNLSMKYFYRDLNSTKVNTGLAVFLTKSILKRTMLDNERKMRKYQRDNIRNLLYMTENIMSHHIYVNNEYGWSDLEYRVTKLYQNDMPLVHSIGKFNRGRLRKWILSNETVNNFAKDIDLAILPKEEFVKLIVYMHKYSISIRDSDTCISRVAYNGEVVDMNKYRRCREDPYCERCISSDPSVAYSLSHRLLNIQLRLDLKRCYMQSVEQDKLLLDKLCAQMYRETVYIARRGYFARDLFLEHIALCAMAGYEEFHRRHWLKKAMSWVNEYGCVKEFRNLDINRTKELIKRNGDNIHLKQRYVKIRCEVLSQICDDHASALLLIVLAHAIRHAAQFKNKIKV